MTVAAACVATVMGIFDASAASGKRIAALDDAHWSSSVWISAANAPVVTGRIEGKNERAADGASYWAIDAGMMRDMAAASGRDAARYATMEADAMKYLRSRFLCDDGSFRTEILNTMQTPALFALKNGLVEGKAKEYKAGAHQVEKVL